MWVIELLKRVDNGKIGEDWFTSDFIVPNKEYGDVLEQCLEIFANKNGIECNVLSEHKFDNGKIGYYLIVTGPKENINIARKIFGNKKGLDVGLVEWREKLPYEI